MGYIILNRLTGKKAKVNTIAGERVYTPYMGTANEVWDYIKKNLSNNTDMYWPHRVGGKRK